MKIISLWDEKGGCGKSTLAYMLGGAAYARGKRVLLIDDDPQCTCFMLAQDENIDFTVINAWPSEAPSDDEYDLIIVDMAPNTNDMPTGVVILPYQPTRISYAVAAKHIPALIDSESTERLVEVITMVDKRKLNHQNFVKGSDALVIASRSVYERATNEGRTVFDPVVKNWSGVREAKIELNLLLDEVLK